jgi:hypothetical protein
MGLDAQVSSRTNLPGGLRRLVGALVFLEIELESVPIGRLDRVDLHVQPVVVHDVQRKDRLLESGVERDEGAFGPIRKGSAGPTLKDKLPVPPSVCPKMSLISPLTVTR